MFHYKDNLFFGRRSDGSVRILKFASPPTDWPAVMNEYPDAMFDAIVDADSWCSVVATVSVFNEQHGTFYAAKNFHDGKRRGVVALLADQ